MGLKNRIKTLREKSNISQVELAERIKVSQQRISQFENQRANPNAEEIDKILKVFDCSFGDLFSDDSEPSESEGNNLLITYKYRDDHVDPNFNELSYGDSGQKAARIKNVLLADEVLKPNSHVVFHTTIGEARYITAYFYIKKLLIKGKDDINSVQGHAKYDEIILIGDRDKSKILSSPLLFDKNLALELHSLGFTDEDFSSTSSELKIISDKTRSHRLLTDNDFSTIITKCNTRG